MGGGKESKELILDKKRIKTGGTGAQLEERGKEGCSVDGIGPPRSHKARKKKKSVRGGCPGVMRGYQQTGSTNHLLPHGLFQRKNKIKKQGKFEIMLNKKGGGVEKDEEAAFGQPKGEGLPVVT